MCAIYQRTIRLTCPHCSHSRILEAVTLWWLFHRKGWNDALPAAIKRFYCKSCWRARHARIRPKYEICTLPPVGAQFTYPPESEWKRLIRGYR